MVDDVAGWTIVLPALPLELSNEVEVSHVPVEFPYGQE